MESVKARNKLNAGFSFDLDPCEREALSDLLEDELDRSMKELERKLQKYWECLE
ncbi:MAG: hypothetical protein ACMUHY_05440 [Thermoplasmatota archaeon]